MKTFLAVFFGVLAAVACLVGFAKWRDSVQRNQQADRLILSSIDLASACHGASPEYLASIRSNLERSEAAIADAKGWDDYSPEHEMKKAALHNQFVAAGCFKY